MELPQQYPPEMWTVRKDDIYGAIRLLQAGLDYAREALSDHDVRLGRTITKNRLWAEHIEVDIRDMETQLARLRAYSGSTMPT